MNHKKLTAMELAARLARPVTNKPGRLISASVIAGAISMGTVHEARADVYGGNIADFDSPQAAYDAGYALGYSSAQNNSPAVWGDEPGAQFGATFGEGVFDGVDAANAANNSNPDSQGTPPNFADPEDPDDPGDPGDDDGGGCGCSCGCG